MSTGYFWAHGDVKGDTNVLGADLNLLCEGAIVRSLGRCGATGGDNGVRVKSRGDVVASVHGGLTKDDKVGARGTTVDGHGLSGGHGDHRGIVARTIDGEFVSIDVSGTGILVRVLREILGDPSGISVGHHCFHNFPRAVLVAIATIAVTMAISVTAAR